MAITKGRDGTVKVGTNAVAELREWSLEQRADVVDDTVLSSTSRVVSPGLKSWSGSVSCFWDATDTNGQEALDVGTTVTLNLYPGGATTGKVEYSGSAVITSISRSANNGNNVEATFAFEGSGDLSQSAVI